MLNSRGSYFVTPTGYLGADREAWKQYDACELVRGFSGALKPPILVDTGSADKFLEVQLQPQTLEAAVKESGYNSATFRIQVSVRTECICRRLSGTQIAVHRLDTFAISMYPVLVRSLPFVFTTVRAYRAFALPQELRHDSGVEQRLPVAAIFLCLQDGYDHSYFFISTFIDDHVNFHADVLLGSTDK